MELVTLSALFVSALVLLILIGWWLTHRLRAVEENSGNAQLLLLQQQIEQLRQALRQQEGTVAQHARLVFGDDDHGLPEQPAARGTV